MLTSFMDRIKAGQIVDFKETMSVIAAYYDYTATCFSNGIEQPLVNQAGQNEGSCKIFAFAKLQGLDKNQTLALFGDFYSKDVLEHPDGCDHQNIRTFMRDGWEGIVFSSEALTPKNAD
jgi:hypothetical protein